MNKFKNKDIIAYGNDSVMPIHFFLICHISSIILMIISEFINNDLISWLSLILFCFLNFLITGKPEYQPTIDYSDITIKYEFKKIMIYIYGFVSILQIVTCFLQIGFSNYIILLIVGQQVLSGWSRLMSDITDSELVFASTTVIESYLNKEVIAQSEFSINMHRNFPSGSTIKIIGRPDDYPGLAWIIEVTTKDDTRKEKLITSNNVGQIYLLSKILRGINFYESEDTERFVSQVKRWKRKKTTISRNK